MEKELTVGQHRIGFDRDATITLYRETITIAGSDSCVCNSCKNFAAQRGKTFPDEFVRLLNELGIDPLKEWEAFDYDAENRMPNEPVLYGGWFVFVGRLLEGIDRMPSNKEGGFAYLFTMSFPAVDVAAEIKLCAVEFLVQIPWVIPEPKT